MLHGDGATVIVVLPWSKEKEATGSAGIELLAARLGEGREAILHEDDEGQSGVEGCAHDGFLAGRDGGRDEDCPLTGCRQITCYLFLHLSRSTAA